MATSSSTSINSDREDDPAPSPPPPSFSDFPEHVQICILSFLTPPDVGNFACTSKPNLSLSRSDADLWYAMCDRRWGSKTQIRNWGAGKIPYRLLYRNLAELENLIGFWRRSDRGTPSSNSSDGSPSPPSLVFFEWGPSFVFGVRVSPSRLGGTYDVINAPFLWTSLSSRGEVVNFLDPHCRIDLSSSSNLVDSAELGFSEGDLVPVSVKFIGKDYLVVEENRSSGCSYSCTSPEKMLQIGYPMLESLGVGDAIGAVGNESPPDRLMSEIYQYFANRTSPSGPERASRRQRRREKERHWKRKREPEHFVKIVNCSPTPSRPLQGLWKGICEDSSLDFYLVAYDDIGGIACHRVGDSSSYSPVFWTSDTTFIELPLSPEEEYLYESRVHIRPHTKPNHTHCPLPDTETEVSRILCINSSYDLVTPDMAGKTNPWLVEGRVWQYLNGTFGFGFLRENFIIDLVHMAQHNHLLDAIEHCIQ